MARKVKPGYKRCPSCSALVKGTRTATCPKCGHDFAGKQKKTPASEPTTAVIEKPTKTADTVSLEQIKKVVQTVQVVGGYARINELLGLIKELGGVKKFKDLLDAISPPAMDDIPF